MLIFLCLNKFAWAPHVGQMPWSICRGTLEDPTFPVSSAIASALYKARLRLKLRAGHRSYALRSCPGCTRHGRICVWREPRGSGASGCRESCERRCTESWPPTCSATTLQLAYFKATAFTKSLVSNTVVTGRSPRAAHCGCQQDKACGSAARSIRRWAQSAW